MNYWAETFNCPIYIHRKDTSYIVNPSRKLQLWDGDNLSLWNDLEIINLGGHFDGGCVFMIQNKTKEGLMLCSDILQIALNKKFIAMMYSYPNNIPLPLSEIRRMSARLNQMQFDTLYGAFKYQNLTQNVRKILNKSVERYLA